MKIKTASIHVLRRLDNVLATTQFRRFGPALCAPDPSPSAPAEHDWWDRHSGARLPRDLPDGWVITGRVIAHGSVLITHLIRQHGVVGAAPCPMAGFTAATDQLIAQLAAAQVPVMLESHATHRPVHFSFFTRGVCAEVCNYLADPHPPVPLDLGPELSRLLAGGQVDCRDPTFGTDVCAAWWQTALIPFRNDLMSLRRGLEGHHVAALVLDASLGRTNADAWHDLDLTTVTGGDFIRAWDYARRLSEQFDDLPPVIALAELMCGGHA